MENLSSTPYSEEKIQEMVKSGELIRHSRPMTNVSLDLICKYANPNALLIIANRIRENVYTQFEFIPVEDLDEYWCGLEYNKDETYYKRVCYLTEIMAQQFDHEPTEEDIKNFIARINICADNGDIFHGNLGSICYYQQFQSDKYVMMFMPVSKVSIVQLKKTYGDWFFEEGKVFNN